MSLKQSHLVRSSDLQRSSPAVRLTVLALVIFYGILFAQARRFPTIKHLASGELMAGAGRDLIPQGVKLRPIYIAGIKLTKQSEGWVPTLYNDAAKYCTIGYGHLVKRAPCNGTEPLEFLKGLTEPQGSDLLVRDLATSQYSVMRSVSVSLTDGQFAALTDFTFNVGAENVRGSTLLRLVNSKELDRIPAQFRRWVLAGGKAWPGLKQRREREIELFFEGLPKPKGLPQPGEDLSPIDVRKGE
jgi:GH24 family phage-related lysozyme (muramidase)